MNIIIIPSWYPKDSCDAVGSFFREQAIALSKYSDHNIIVVVFDNYGIRTFLNGKKPKKEDYIDNGVHIIRQPIFGNSNSFSKFGLTARKKVIAKVLDNLDLSIKTIFHAHSAINEGYFAGIYAKHFNLPLIITEHHSMFIEKSANKNALVKFESCIKTCNKMLFVSGKFKERMECIFGEIKNSDVIHNPVNLTKIKLTKNKENKLFTYLCVGGLQKRKGIHFLIDAFTKSFKSNKAVILKIIGNGKMYDSLRDKINAMEMSEQIYLLGSVAREDIGSYYEKANAFALTSECESFGIVYIEALSAGIPVLGTKGEGDEEIINSECGLLTEYGNIEEISKALEYVFNNYSQYDCNKIREYCENNFSERIFVEKMEKFYEELK